MRATTLLLALVGCSSTRSGVPVNLTVMNATERPEKVATSIHDARTGEEHFRRTSLLLSGGAEEMLPAARVPADSKLKVCTTLPTYSEEPDAHYCTTYSVGALQADCFSSAFPRNGAPPYASAACHEGAPLED